MYVAMELKLKPNFLDTKMMILNHMKPLCKIIRSRSENLSKKLSFSTMGKYGFPMFVNVYLMQIESKVPSKN